MEIKKKEIAKQSFTVTAASGNYVVSALITTNKDGKVTSMENGTVTDGDMYMANFAEYDGRPSYNFTGEYALTVRQKVVALIDELKQSV